MTTSQGFEQGDVVVIFVPFPNQPASGATHPDQQAYARNGLWGKDRPTVVVSVERHNRADDLLVALLTTNTTNARRRGEYVLRRWVEAGLRRESAVRPRLFQVVKGDVTSRLRRIHPGDRAGLIAMLKDLLGI